MESEIPSQFEILVSVHFHPPRFRVANSISPPLPSAEIDIIVSKSAFGFCKVSHAGRIK